MEASGHAPIPLNRHFLSPGDTNSAEFYNESESRRILAETYIVATRAR